MNIRYIITVYKSDIFSACISQSCVSCTSRAQIPIQIDNNYFIGKSLFTVQHNIETPVGRSIIDQNQFHLRQCLMYKISKTGSQCFLCIVNWHDYRDFFLHNSRSFLKVNGKCNFLIYS